MDEGVEGSGPQAIPHGTLRAQMEPQSHSQARRYPADGAEGADERKSGLGILQMPHGQGIGKSHGGVVEEHGAESVAVNMPKIGGGRRLVKKDGGNKVADGQENFGSHPAVRDLSRYQGRD